MTSLESPLLVSKKGPLEIWTLNRPDRRNALSRELVRDLAKNARRVNEDVDVRAVIITAAGEQAFCAGADLKERKDMSEDDVRDFLSLYRVCFRDLDRCKKPIVAALNGVAFGGGLEVALACDFRVAASHVQVGLTETSLGIIPGAGGTQRLVREMGLSKAKELILFAKRLNAQEALSYGLLNLVANEGETALACAERFVAPLLEAAPIAISAALDAIDAACDLSLEEGFSFERVCYERTLQSEDRLEALKAFSEKRKPVYSGR